ncbi:MAG: ribonuclease R, partial [Candidatus Zixiibacteriota bacterium]
QIIEYIKSKLDHPMKIKELARILDIPPDEYSNFRKTIKQLVSSGQLVKLKRNRIGIAEQLNLLVGKITISRKGTGFLEREEEEVDILIPQAGLFTALDGDRVMVRLTGKVMGRQAGVVVRIVERAPRKIVGVFRTSGAFTFVTPDNPRYHRDIYINPQQTMGAREGEKVVAELTVWDNPYVNPEGRITEVIGMPGEPGVDMLSVLRSFDLPEKFPEEVMSEAEQAAARNVEEELKNRLDLTREDIYTIDPSDAKDHDDAVSVEETPEGFRLGVHIADVSFFVEAGTRLDDEAFLRGNSVYLPGMVVPMLPEVLSNDVCSLKPNRRRLAHSTLIDLDKQGKILKWRVVDTVINSKARLSYEEVQEFYDTGTANKRVAKVADNLKTARKLAEVLSRKRFGEGSLDFDLPEAKIILNEKGEVIELGNRVRLESHRLIEEFMLLANKVVALEVFRLAQPFLYRVHDKPDPEKLEFFSHVVKTLGYNFPVSREIKPMQFARFIKQVKGTPEEEFINELMLRSMQKAVYQRENIGHFGLAFSHYTHFTSPIRRYPDLLVHRLLRKLKNGKYPVAFARRVNSVIDRVGQHCSDTERTAEAAERQAVKIKQVAFMAKHLGDEYTGIISGVTNFGFFVRIDNMGVEGMVRVSTIDDDYYLFDESRYRLIGRRNKRTFRLGDRVEVGVMKVDKTRNEIDLFLADKKSKRAAGRVTAPGGKKSFRGRGKIKKHR